MSEKNQFRECGKVGTLLSGGNIGGGGGGEGWRGRQTNSNQEGRETDGQTDHRSCSVTTDFRGIYPQSSPAISLFSDKQRRLRK